MGYRGVEQAAIDQQCDHGLSRLYGIGIDRHPGIRRLDRLLERTCAQRDLGRALRDARITRRLREVVQRRRGDVVTSALGGDLGQQVLEHHLPAEFQPRQARVERRALIAAGSALCGRARLRQPCPGRYVGRYLAGRGKPRRQAGTKDNHRHTDRAHDVRGGPKNRSAAWAAGTEAGFLGQSRYPMVCWELADRPAATFIRRKADGGAMSTVSENVHVCEEFRYICAPSQADRRCSVCPSRMPLRKRKMSGR